MNESYFFRLTSQTPSKFWINNPTRDQAHLAIAHNALGCTCNPSFSQKMIDNQAEGTYALDLLDESIHETDNDKLAAEVFQRKLVKPISDYFMPIYKKTPGIDGYVSIQADPINEHWGRISVVRFQPQKQG
jgi:transaldolase